VYEVYYIESPDIRPVRLQRLTLGQRRMRVSSRNAQTAVPVTPGQRLRSSVWSLQKAMGRGGETVAGAMEVEAPLTRGLHSATSQPFLVTEPMILPIVSLKRCVR
jgi:hypothetical protein